MLWLLLVPDVLLAIMTYTVPNSLLRLQYFGRNEYCSYYYYYYYFLLFTNLIGAWRWQPTTI
jgi:hypothetical protein